MEIINKRRLSYCIIISFLINGIFFINQLSEHRLLKEAGIIKELYVKSLNKDEATFFQKVKYTSVAKTYFITSEGDSIYDIRKNIWAMQVEALKGINFYVPVDSIIYDSNSPKDYQLISEYRNYSTTYSSLAYFIIGPIIFSAWLYLLTFLLEKGFAKFRTK